MVSASLVTALNRGGLAVIPTDTLYGIVACARNKDAAERLYTLRHTSSRKPFIILIDRIETVTDFGVILTTTQKQFLKKVWPGKVSVILPCTLKRFSYLHRGTQSLAFRVPKPKNLRALLRKTGPLVAPSANSEGEKPAQTIREAKKYFGDAVALYVPGLVRRAPSTLISMLGPTPVVIRRGTVKIS